MPMVRLGAADCQCIAPPCPCDMKLVYDPGECPLGTTAEIYRPELPPGTASPAVVQYRCIPTSPMLAGFGITPRWLLIGGLALAALWFFSSGKEKE
jgi:hypothetical protein